MAHDSDLDMEIPELGGEGAEEQWQPEVELDLEGAESGGMMVADGPETPPERVRFTAPAVLAREGDDDAHDAATLNLSVRGVALVSPARLRPGERVWIDFRLGLGEEPLSLLGAVVWCGQEAEAGRLYGLQFVSLTQEEEDRIGATVRERSEGRAAEWALPVMPEAQPTPPRSGPSPWVSAAAGMAAGIGLALALAVIPKAGVSGTPPAESVATAETAAVAPRPAASLDTAAPAAARPSLDAPSAPAVEPSTDADTGAMAAAATAPAAQPATPAEAAAAAGAPAAQEPGGLLPRREPPPPATAEAEVLRPLGTADGVELALVVDGPVEEHVSFWLDSPRRLVVDVFGRKSGFARSSYVIEHPLATQLRVGQHPGKVRFVIEAADEVSSEVRTRPSDTGLLVELARR